MITFRFSDYTIKKLFLDKNNRKVWNSYLYKKQNLMLTDIIPKLPMRDKNATKAFYMEQLAFTEIGDYGDYLLLKKDNIEIHFFEFKELKPEDNYGQVYIRTQDIEDFYQSLLDKKVSIHPNAPLQNKPWGQKEFALLDPDNNLLTFGESIT